MGKQGTVDTTNLNTEQLQFVVTVLADVVNELIQDDMALDENAMPLPANDQPDELIKKAMKLLQYD